MDAVRCYIDKAQDCWDEHLAQIAGALRSAVNRHSGFTANKLMLGREVNTTASLMYRSPMQESPVNLDTYVAIWRRGSSVRMKPLVDACTSLKSV